MEKLISKIVGFSVLIVALSSCHKGELDSSRGLASASKVAESSSQFSSRLKEKVGANAKGRHDVTFVVAEPGLSLSVISTMVFGTCKRWKEIAEWNHLKNPHKIFLGQKLRIKQPVHLTKKEVDRRLLKLWQSRLGKREKLLVEKYWKAHQKTTKHLRSRRSQSRSHPVRHFHQSQHSRHLKSKAVWQSPIVHSSIRSRHRDLSSHHGHSVDSSPSHKKSGLNYEKP